MLFFQTALNKKKKHVAKEREKVSRENSNEKPT